MRFLLGFQWPPRSKGQTARDSKLTVRHRISTSHDSPAEASVRTIESFFPTHPSQSHVLVLSPNAELSPLYFHYLKFLVYKYKHSIAAANEKSNNLLGISLDSPILQLDGKTKLASDVISPPLIQWQSPNSNAALYFGDRWIELHSFISNRLKTQSTTATEAPKKLVSEIYPAWLEFLLELTRLRSYSMLYPSFSSSSASDSSLVTIHQELYTPPEEFMKDATPLSPTDPETPPASQPPLDPFFLDTTFHATPPSQEPTLLKPSTSGLLSLFGIPTTGGPGSDLPGLEDMTLLTYDGQKVTQKAADRASAVYIDEFAVEKGGCKNAQERTGEIKQWRTDDLFCLKEEE